MIVVSFVIFCALAVIHAEPIVYGQPAGKYPFIVYIQITSKEYHSPGLILKRVSECGGTILSPTAILTAAHCLTNTLTHPDITVYAGFRKINELKTFAKSRRVLTYDIHPDFGVEEIVDIAVLHLTIPLPMSPGIVEIGHIGRPILNAQATAIGWGITEDGDDSDKLLETKLRIVRRKVCNPYYAIDDDYIVCAWADNRISSICVGDSGGPLVLGGKIVGVTSRILSTVVVTTKESTDKFCYGDRPGVFVNPYKYLQWIQKQINF